MGPFDSKVGVSRLPTHLIVIMSIVYIFPDILSTGSTNAVVVSFTVVVHWRKKFFCFSLLDVSLPMAGYKVNEGYTFSLDVHSYTWFALSVAGLVPLMTTCISFVDSENFI